MKLRKLPICGTVVSEYGTIANETVTFVTHTRNGSVTEFEHSVRISVTDFATSDSMIKNFIKKLFNSRGEDAKRLRKRYF